MKERDKFGSRLGFILVSAGCAVGLGNVWKFPYICGQNGGAAFILIYLVFLTILGLPILISEFAVGRGSRFGVAKAYEKLEPEGTKWSSTPCRHKSRFQRNRGKYKRRASSEYPRGKTIFSLEPYVFRSACIITIKK